MQEILLDVYAVIPYQGAPTHPNTQSIYTAGLTDNTIIHSNHKMKGSKMWKIKISAGHSKKKYAYAILFFHVCSSSDSVHKSFKGFDVCGQLLFQVKVLQERFYS